MLIAENFCIVISFKSTCTIHRYLASSYLLYKGIINYEGMQYILQTYNKVIKSLWISEVVNRDPINTQGGKKKKKG